MAFCPLCGKQLPPDGICSCGKKLDENGNIISNAAVQQPEQPQMRPVQQPQAPVQQAQPVQMRPVQQAQPQAQAPVQQAQPQMRPIQQPQAPVQQGQSQMPPVQQPQAVPQPGQQAQMRPIQSGQQQMQPGQAYPPQGVPGQPYPPQGAPGQPYPPQGMQMQPGQPPMQPYPPMPKVPSGPNPFGEAFKAFAAYFKNPSGTSKGIFEGKIPVASGLILGGLYFIVLLLSLTLFGFGVWSRTRFLRAFGYGSLATTIICGLKCGTAALIMAFSKNKSAGYVKILSSLCVDTVLIDCIVAFAGIIGLGAPVFAMFFLLLAIALCFYLNKETLTYLSGDAGAATPNKMFWFNGILLASNALIYMITYVILVNQGRFF